MRDSHRRRYDGKGATRNHNMTIAQFELEAEPAKTPLESRDITFWGCGLAGEAGEVCNVAKKMDRDGTSDEHDEHMLEEAGDTLFYLRCMLHKRGLTLVDAALYELNKLDQIRERGSIR